MSSTILILLVTALFVLVLVLCFLAFGKLHGRGVPRSEFDRLQQDLALERQGKATLESELEEVKGENARLEGELATQKALRESESKAAEERQRQSDEHYRQLLAQTKEGGEKALEQAKKNYEDSLSQAQKNYNDSLFQAQKNYNDSLSESRKNYDKTVSDLKEAQKEAIDAAKNSLSLENEKQLKQREESLKGEAAQTMKTITESLEKSVKEMKDSFEAQKKASSEGATSIKTKFDETVEGLRRQTEAIGHQAGDLARAFRGQNKMQGVFGETILENLLRAEGLQKGRDYDAEEYLRNEKGEIIQNEESGHKMRPDFVLHFPDGSDVLIDSKVSLTALSDYFAATDEPARKSAAKRNLESVQKHIDELAGKEYQKYSIRGKTMDYVIMFIPNYGAYQLAKQENPDIFSEAFRKNVLITTEETLIPFVRLIRTAWVQKIQVDNVQKIIEAANKMVDRVAIFAEANEKVKTSLHKSVELFDKNSERLSDSKQSIVKAARDAIAAGATLTGGKTLPELTYTLPMHESVDPAEGAGDDGVPESGDL